MLVYKLTYFSKMENSRCIFLLCIIAATTKITSSENAFMKCCKNGMKLHSYSTKCINDTTAVLPQNSNETTETNRTESIETNKGLHENNTSERGSSDLTWLPKEVRDGTEGNVVIEFGRPTICNNSRTVRLKTPEDSDRFHLFPNGTLLLRPYSTMNYSTSLFYLPREFCIDTFTVKNSTHFAILLCACDRVQCVRKCCDKGEAFFYQKRSGSNCRKHKDAGEWKPFVADIPGKNLSYEVVINSRESCRDGYSTLRYEARGPPHVIENWYEIVKDDNTACEEQVADSTKTIILMCNKKLPFSKIHIVGNRMHIVEAILWALIILTTLLAPRRRISEYSRVHDMALVWHAMCLFLRCLVWTAFYTLQGKCLYTPFMIYFLSIAASFWLNVLCINMTCGFWKPLASLKGNRGWCSGMSLWYSLYAWGASAAMTGLTAYMWYSPTIPAGFPRPTLHEARNCFVEQRTSGKMGTFAYFYGPVSGLLVVNALLFSSTACRVMELTRHRNILNKDRQSSTKSNSSFRNEKSAVTYIKLLFLMGVLEMAVEIIAWLLDPQGYIFRLSASCVDLLRAIAMFVLCCCKKRTLRGLRDRFCACGAVGACRRWRTERSAQEPTSTVTELSSNTDVPACETEARMTTTEKLAMEAIDATSHM